MTVILRYLPEGQSVQIGHFCRSAPLFRAAGLEVLSDFFVAVKAGEIIVNDICL